MTRASEDHTGSGVKAVDESVAEDSPTCVARFSLLFLTLFLTVLAANVSDCGERCVWRQRHQAAATQMASSLPLCRDRVSLGPLVAVNVSDSDEFPFRPQACRFRHWDTLSAQDCLRGRQVFVVGNSVAREFYGHVMAQMCEQARDRVGEKLVCKADLGFCSRRCDASLDAEFGSRFAHFHTNRMSDPLPPGFRYHDEEKCPQSAQECLALFLQDSRPGDVLVFFVGVALAWEFKHITSAEAGDETAMTRWPRGTGNGDPKPDELPRFDSIVNSSARAWRNLVQAAWHGRAADVYRVRNAPFCVRNARCDTDNLRWGHPGAFLGSTSKMLHRVNVLHDAVFSEAGAASAAWGVVDQEAINGVSGGNDYYVDFIRE